MRKYAFLPKKVGDICKVMIYESHDGDEVYIFLYDNIKNTPCFADYHFETLEEAKEYCHTVLGVRETDWYSIPDPQEGCQHDLI